MKLLYLFLALFIASSSLVCNANNISLQEKFNIKSLTLILERSSLNVDENTTLSVIATYDDNSSKDVTNEVEWSFLDPDIVQITQNLLYTKKDTNILLQASYKNITSNSVALEIYKEINGHKLPPQPDETINNSTLLGIDSNSNGVRDDVERWIYETYKDKHPVHIDIAMQAGRAYKKVLETPEKALEIHDEVGAPQYCQYYYQYDAKYFNEPLLVENRIITHTFIKEVYFNTDERLSAYLQYDKLLSGGVYTLPKKSARKSLCDFNTSKYEK